jgi:hypothetical protein
MRYAPYAQQAASQYLAPTATQGLGTAGGLELQRRQQIQDAFSRWVQTQLKRKDQSLKNKELNQQKEMSYASMAAQAVATPLTMGAAMAFAPASTFAKTGIDAATAGAEAATSIQPGISDIPTFAKNSALDPELNLQNLNSFADFPTSDLVNNPQLRSMFNAF